MFKTRNVLPSKNKFGKITDGEYKENYLNHELDGEQVLAAYADSLYTDVVTYVESRDFEIQQKLAKIRHSKAEELNRLKTQTSDQEVRRASHYMTHETIKDESEFETLFQQRQVFLIQVLPFIRSYSVSNEFLFQICQYSLILSLENVLVATV